jgi:replicative DNA helicase
LYRDDYNNKDSPTPGVTEAIVAKQRNGAIGTANLFFVKGIQRFTDIATIRQELTY